MVKKKDELKLRTNNNLWRAQVKANKKLYTLLESLLTRVEELEKENEIDLDNIKVGLNID